MNEVQNYSIYRYITAVIVIVNNHINNYDLCLTLWDIVL